MCVYRERRVGVERKVKECFTWTCRGDQWREGRGRVREKTHQGKLGRRAREESRNLFVMTEPRISPLRRAEGGMSGDKHSTRMYVYVVVHVHPLSMYGGVLYYVYLYMYNIMVV
jgi:hypothetical protein